MSRLEALRHLIALAVVLGVIAGAGVVAARSLEVSPSGALAGCHTARKLGPHTYLGPPPMCIDTNRAYLADITTTRGKLSILIKPSDDPVTINNFVVLASNGYYDGLTFWRVQDWYALAGDPLSNGHGGPGYTLPDEGSSTGKWVIGSVAMARDLPNGHVNGSQFFILRANWPNGGPPKGQTYNRLGTLVAGTDILPTLTAGDTIVSITIRPA